MSLRRDFARLHPEFPLLEEHDRDGVADLMTKLGWLEDGESIVACERAGEGNMNLTLRVRTDRRSVILKQSRPWVEKHEHIEAPLDRALIEQRFYRRVAKIPRVAKAMPELLGAGVASRTLLLEDLGEAHDLTYLYRARRDPLELETVRALGEYLAALHGATRGEAPEDLRNRDMRRLNHQHIYQVPFQEQNGVALDDYEPGLAEVAASLCADDPLRDAVDRLGARYLAGSEASKERRGPAGAKARETQPTAGSGRVGAKAESRDSRESASRGSASDEGRCLVHGDFFPGSWLATPAGVRVIDPEFCFFGDPELDLGVAVAHLAMARQPFDLGLELIEAADADPAHPLHRERIAQYAGIEIIRRLLGVAQLPIEKSDGFRRDILERARGAILERKLETLRA